ncbi:hypothetical protein LEP1GSC068_3763 [Leptospira sp. Fiocruz LV3954]|nr:hypothetical protein LEP1GSC068_3763 [Leptospira sp. Fiocruz LV3954]
MNVEVKNLPCTNMKKENNTKDLFEIGRVNGNVSETTMVSE